MNVTPRQDLIDRLRDPAYAKLYGEEQAKVDFTVTLSKARNSVNMTQKELSEKLNTSQPYIAKLEGGEANPTLGSIGRILAVLGYRLLTGFAPLMPEPIPTTAPGIIGSAVSGTVEGSVVDLTGGEEELGRLYPVLVSKVGTTSGIFCAEQEEQPLTLARRGGSV